MGLWGDIAGGLAAVGGFVAAPFTGGLSIPAGLGAAGAIISGSAVSDAAKKQQQATDQALALQGRMYDTTRADLSPYSSIGVGALGNLRTLAGIPQPAPTAGPGAAPLVPPNAPHATAGPGTPGFGGFTGQQAVPRPGVPAPPQNASGFVTMRAADGSTNQVPAAAVSYYQQKGAQVLQ
jgi:hypothetical protein